MTTVLKRHSSEDLTRYVSYNDRSYEGDIVPYTGITDMLNNELRDLVTHTTISSAITTNSSCIFTEHGAESEYLCPVATKKYNYVKYQDDRQ